MSIEEVSLDQTAAADIFEFADAKSEWNGREVEKLDEPDLHAILQKFPPKYVFQHHPKMISEQRMSKRPDRSEAKVDIGYNEEKGVYVQGTWVWTWIEHSDKEGSTDSNTGTSSSDIDSRDRDFDNGGG